MHRWRIAIAGVVFQMTLGSVYAWSVFKKPFMDGHGWSGEQAGFAFTLVILFTGVAAALGGRWVDRAGARKVAMLAATLFGTGTLLTGVADAIDSRALLYVGYGVVCGAGNGLGYVTPIAVLARWFPDKRGLVTGMAVAGFGLGAAAMGQIAPFVLPRLGLANTFYVIGCLDLVTLLGAAQLLDNPPAGWSPPAPVERRPVPAVQAVDLSGALSMYQFYILWALFFLNATAGAALISNLSIIAQEACGIGAVAAGTVVLASFIGDASGRLGWAAISDRLGRKGVFVLLFGTEAPLLYLLPDVNDAVVFSVVAAYVLSCFGGGLATLPAYAADTFGAKNMGRIYGKVILAWVGAGLVGPLLMESAKKGSGSFQTGIRVAAALIAGAFVLNLLYRPPSTGTVPIAAPTGGH